MKLKVIPAAHELISNMKSLFQFSDSKMDYSIEEPLRGELFSTEQMEALGTTLASKHTLSSISAKDHLLKRLADNEKCLDDARKLLNDSIKKKQQLTPPGEWLIDNFYLIEEHIRIAKTHFPKHYSEDLPQLLNDSINGVPRIYDIVLQITSHSDGRIDLESIKRWGPGLPNGAQRLLLAKVSQRQDVLKQTCTLWRGMPLYARMQISCPL